MRKDKSRHFCTGKVGNLSPQHSCLDQKRPYKLPLPSQKARYIITEEFGFSSVQFLAIFLNSAPLGAEHLYALGICN